MRVVHEPPPKRVFQACIDKFGASWDDGVIWAYGNAIHSKYPIRDKSLYAHEGTHLEQQQTIGVVKWWDQYLEDPEFRFSQELEAYQAQWQWIKKNLRSREEQVVRLSRLAKDFSSPMYGNIVTYQEALTRIKNG